MKVFEQHLSNWRLVLAQQVERRLTQLERGRMLRKLEEKIVNTTLIALMLIVLECIISGYGIVKAADRSLASNGERVINNSNISISNDEASQYPTSGVPAVVPAAPIPEENPIVINEVNYEKYVVSVINVRIEPNVDCEVLGKYVPGDKITVTGQIEGNDFVRINYKGQEAFVHSEYLSDEPPVTKWQGPTINRWCGTVHGPSGKETYYNLPMEGCIRLARAKGIGGNYWVRADGCKMLGNYIMVATDTRRWPEGTILETSLGTAMVIDHCGSASRYSGRWIDIAVNW